MKSRKIELHTECDNFSLKTDSALLKRILLNMAKNAAEAVEDHGIITIGCHTNGTTASFSVNNKGVIPEDVRYQVFQRSFSTKGHGRGLGTYSMKLFGENYLHGKVYFHSCEPTGTTFYIELPLRLETPTTKKTVEPN
jgi:signal transduction histidine kinase